MQKNILKLLVIFIIGVGLLTGCGKDNTNSSSANKTETAQTNSVYSKIKASGEIKIGTEGTYAPYTYHDESGELVGYDVEVAKLIAQKLGVKPVFVETKWDSMIAGLDADRFDIIVNEVGATDERKQKYDFSEPYIYEHGVLLTSKANQDIKKFEDIKGKNAAQSLTSNWGADAEKYGAVLVGVDGFEQAVELIQSGRADATINGEIAYLDYIKKKPDADLKIVATTKDSLANSIPVKKGNEDLIKVINQAIEELKADGSLAQLSIKYFGKDISKE
ncbi:amino acid ABC transporter substrate-binding protein [Pectinatus frisingensis]|uniref:amino acid ABC transporter substrate-binding protein n=1 Tax=Pectinatus frisingensis TaxID=865 RepID=UPI0018C82E86|nr:amino acid ABC transporter substrate-binding protein [Pectinatus frisingensis]